VSLQTFFDNFALLADAPNGVAKLRELVLQLAVQGRLVHQDPNDEPAKILLAAIADQRQRNAQEDGRKALQPLQPISTAEMPFQLPQGWSWERLGNIGDTNIGLTYSPQNVGETGVPVLRSSNIQNGKIDLSDLVRVAIDPKRNVLVEVGDLLICARNGSRALVGKVALIEYLPEKTAFGAFMAIFRSSMNEYIYHFIRSPLFRQMIAEVNTTTINQITQTNLRSTIVPIPPLTEQKRIVAKVDELMRLCDELEARQQARRESRVRLNNATLAPLNNAASLAPEEFEQASVRLSNNFTTLYDSAETINRLRSTILQLAVQGKLVLQDPHDKTASVLLERIKEEKERLIKEKKIRKEDLLPIIQPRAFGDELPDKWVKVRLGEVVNCLDFLRKPINKEERQLRKGSIPYYGANGQVGWIDDYLFDEDLVLVVEDETFIGRILPFSYKITGKSWVNNHAHVLQSTSGVDVDFLNFSLARYPFIELTSGTTGRKKLTKSTLLSVAFRLPPLEEQKRIVAKVNQLMALCDELEIKLRQTEADSGKLMKAAVRDLLQIVDQSHSEEAFATIAL
jgi:type I restriction enzyme S subunit